MKVRGPPGVNEQKLGALSANRLVFISHWQLKMMQSEYDIEYLFQEAKRRWLKPAEVLFILQNHEKYELTQEPPQKPAGGSLYLFNKRVLRFFRKDGHSWRRKKDGRAIAEAHERLKVGNIEALNCYYAHGGQNPNFQRRSFWMLDPSYEHIVLVHYRDISEGKPSSGNISLLSPNSSSFSTSPGSSGTLNPGSTTVINDSHELHHISSSPGSIEVSSEIVIENNGVQTQGEFTNSAEFEVSEALRRIEEQLSLNEDTLKDIDPFYDQDGNANDAELLEYKGEISKQDQLAATQYRVEDFAQEQFCGEYAERQIHPNNLGQLKNDPGSNGKYVDEQYPYWKEMLRSWEVSSSLDPEEKQPPASKHMLPEAWEDSYWLNHDGSRSEISCNSVLLPPGPKDSEILAYTSGSQTLKTSSDYHAMLFEPSQNRMLIETSSSLTVAQMQKFTIREISPNWGYASELTKVIIVGSFLCNPSESTWACMFGDTEVPLQIIQEGVICCEAPPHLPGKVTLCITTANRESCSEIREFEYRDKTGNCSFCNLYEMEVPKSPDELLLLVRFVQMLLSDSESQKGESMESGIHLSRKSKPNEDSWSQVIEALLFGSGSPSGTIDWLLQELLKDKLHQWLSSKSQDGHDLTGCSLSKKEQGIIHMVAGLGFEWALNSILSHSVSINFRDINGWTALHWAARFGREKMVAALLASGASAGAVTDPNSKDPTGKTPASVAASCGHKGLAGYLSEVALTSHLSSLKLEESELSKGSAEVQAEITVNSISKRSLGNCGDQLSLKDTLAAVRNAAQAAARIQSAFRAHSFRRRQQREAAISDARIDGYLLNSDDIKGLSAMSKLAFGTARDSNLAALSIQKKYRGWKGRKEFLALRQKVVKIQAHVRGYQIRKYYKVIWAVGILEKVVLRWRRKGVGLRGYRHEMESINETEDEDILKVFRRQKVDVELQEAVSRVLSMVDSEDARQQYRRMLDKYHQAKAELDDTGEASPSIAVSDIEKNNYHDFL